VSQTMSLRIPDDMAERLDRLDRRLGSGATRSRVSILLLEESLRETEFAHIEFRDSPVGRQPYMKESGLAVWEVIMVAKDHKLDPQQTSDYFQRNMEWVQAALIYYSTYHDEIDLAIADNEIGLDALRKLLPGIRLFEDPARGLLHGNVS